MASKSIGDFKHPWKVSTEQAKEIQSKLSFYISLEDGFEKVKRIVGVGIAFSKDEAKVSAVEFSYPELILENRYSRKEKLNFPYIPNFFAFSVGPTILSLMEKIKKPYIALFPGRGVAHPRGLGLASHLGLLLDVPSIACSKGGLWTRDLHIDLKKGTLSLSEIRQER